MRRSLALAVTIALVSAACGDDDDNDSGGGSTDVGEVTAGEAFPDDRCEANRAAGPITFLTSFDFAAAASIVDVLVAEERGYYDAVCLDVTVTPSFSTENYPLVASGEAQFSSGGSFSEVAAFAASGGSDLVVLAVEGHVPIDVLMVRDGIADSLEQLEGSTIGVQGRTPTSIAAMLATAGLTEGEGIETVPLPGFDAVANMELDTLVGITGYKSNEVGQLEAAGVAVDLFDPADYEVPGSFGVIYTSAAFRDEHPSAVDDFLRATLRGLEDALADPAAAAGIAVAAAEANGNAFFFSIEGETFRWSTEAELAVGSAPDGEPVGTPDVERLQDELDTAAEFGVFGDDEPPSADDLVDAGVIDRLVDDDGAVVWPG